MREDFKLFALYDIIIHDTHTPIYVSESMNKVENESQYLSDIGHISHKAYIDIYTPKKVNITNLEYRKDEKTFIGTDISNDKYIVVEGIEHNVLFTFNGNYSTPFWESIEPSNLTGFRLYSTEIIEYYKNLMGISL